MGVPSLPSVPPPVRSSNGVAIAFDDDHFAPMRDSTDQLHDPVGLRRIFVQDGHVLLRSVLDRDRVLDLRQDYFERFDSSLLASGTRARDGVFSGTVRAGLAPYGTPGHPAYDLVRSMHFDRFTADSVLLRIAETLLDGPAELVPRRILRHFHQGSGAASRAHIDYDYMGEGSDEFVTAWIPLGDCPIECGGLVYLEGSHRFRQEDLDRLRPFTDRPHDQRPLSNDLALTARTLGGRWLWTDFRAGDVVLHSPYIVHASLDVLSPVMRLSTDLRYRRIDAATDPRWNQAWSADDGY